MKFTNKSSLWELNIILYFLSKYEIRIWNRDFVLKVNCLLEKVSMEKWKNGNMKNISHLISHTEALMIK